MIPGNTYRAKIKEKTVNKALLSGKFPPENYSVLSMLGNGHSQCRSGSQTVQKGPGVLLCTKSHPFVEGCWGWGEILWHYQLVVWASRFWGPEKALMQRKAGAGSWNLDSHALTWLIWSDMGMALTVYVICCLKFLTDTATDDYFFLQKTLFSLLYSLLYFCYLNPFLIPTT